ncbi:MAG: gliding motility-associated ABC transporter substrate-binding protein GldG [Chitinophagaceae bacterium]|nr:gliding motility-associated ABC transporter substrate-binding protein GldG [Chitinophagaceae bacterium]
MAKNIYGKKSKISRFVIIAAILLLLNIISTKLNFRLDLTKEKRFSLTSTTKKLLSQMDDVALIKIYLTGKFPAGFIKLQEATKDILTSFNTYSNGKVKFVFENPLEGKSEKEIEETYKIFVEKNIQGINLQVQGDETEGYSQKRIFPAALVSYKGKDVGVNLLENHIGMNSEELLNYSESQLEYKFAQAIKKTLATDKITIAYAAGQGELLDYRSADMLNTLAKNYRIDTLDLNQNFEIPLVYKALIICKPTQLFPEKVKFKIDQYIMGGGKVLWLLDKLNASMDTLRNVEAFMANDYGNNLDDMLFKYGVRINPDIVEDYQQNNPIPITMGMIGDQPDIKLLPWVQFPFALPTSKHSIVKNMDAVMFQFASSIDTIGNPEIKKTILLESSNRSRRVPAPVRISLANLQYKPKVELFQERNIPMAVLLEGKFLSVFANRGIDPQSMSIYQDSLGKKFYTEAVRENKMIVVSDADVMVNDASMKRGIMETGYYQYTDKLFANKSFLLNCLEYLVDDNNVLDARNKELSLRLLDMPRVKAEKLQWQLLNIILPIILTLFFGSAFFFFRRKKYTGKVS